MRLQPLGARERAAVGLWVVIAAVAGNGAYDVLVSRGIKEYLLRHALSEAGRGPAVSMALLMQVTVFHAACVGLFWGCAILLAGMLTIRLMRARPG